MNDDKVNSVSFGKELLSKLDLRSFPSSLKNQPTKKSLKGEQVKLLRGLIKNDKYYYKFCYIYIGFLVLG